MAIHPDPNGIPLQANGLLSSPCSMTPPNTQTAVVHDAANHRFTTHVDGYEGYVEYDMDGDVLVILHTIVPAEIGGRGIGAALTAAVLRHAREHVLKIRPVCSYASAYMQRHPEYADLLAPGVSDLG
ncbi:GNAT family N-acetyltransferase [Bordetella bronchialis]